jgi:hypothetical protein
MQYKKQPVSIKAEGKVFIKPDCDSPLIKFVYDLETAIAEADKQTEQFHQRRYVAPVEGGYVVVDRVEHRMFFGEDPGDKVSYQAG